MDWYSMTNQKIEEEIGQRIQKVRLNRNMTQLELAKKSGLSRVAISRIEGGKGANLSSLIEILRVLDLLQNVDTLLPTLRFSPLELLKLQKSTRKRASSTKRRIKQS
jgi:transcriptional regulator with XRE-family HTH domain